MCGSHVVRQPQHAQPGEAGGQIGVAVIDGQHILAAHVETLPVPLQGVGLDLAGTRPEETDDTVVAGFRLLQIGQQTHHTQLPTSTTQANARIASNRSMRAPIVWNSQRDVVFPSGRQALYERNRYSPAMRSNGFQARLDTLMKARPDYWGEAPCPTLTGVGVTWLSGFAFEIKGVARLPQGDA